MSKIFKIFMTDLKRISTNVVAVVIFLGLSIIPCLYAWFNIFSNWDPYGPDSTGNVQVAVISADKGTEIAGLKLNIGNTVIEGLEANRTIGWIFTENVSDTIKGVESGDYYAALVIPENFSEDMISFLNGEIEHPTITYYENEKKNAIAPKITQKAWKTVKEQVNASFVSTLAETLMKAGNAISSADNDQATIADSLTTNLSSLSEDMDNYISILTSFNNIMCSAEGIISTTRLMLPNLETMMSGSKASISSMQSVLNTNESTVNTVSSLIISSFDMIDSSLTMIANITDSNLATAGAVSDTVIRGVGTISTLADYSLALYNTSISGVEATADEATKTQINTVRESFETLKQDTDRLGQAAAIAKYNNEALVNNISAELKNCSASIRALESTYSSSVQPQLTATITSSQDALNSTIDALSTINMDFDDIDAVLAQYSETMQTGSDSLAESLVLAQELLDSMQTLVDNMSGLNENEKYNRLLEIMDTNPELLGKFVASPVSMENVAMFPIDNYGSAMAPFYTVLAIWVGALFLVAIIHVHVHPVEGMPFEPRHAYFGRYLTFFLVGQVQALITVLGDLFFIQIQCKEPFLFWLAASVSSLVFTLFIYSLTVAFGNIGEAIAIIVMVIQVAGAGCTFPIETLPKVFQYIYDYLPFQFAMNAFKETVGGLYEIDYWKYLVGLSAYILVSLVIGLVLAIPFRKLNLIIEHSKERSGIML